MAATGRAATQPLLDNAAEQQDLRQPEGSPYAEDYYQLNGQTRLNQATANMATTIIGAVRGAAHCTPVGRPSRRHTA